MRHWYNQLKRNKKVVISLLVTLFILAFLLAGYVGQSEYHINIWDTILKEPYRLIAKLFISDNKQIISSNDKTLSTQNEALKNEIKELQALLKVESLIADYDMVNATIISRKDFEWYNTILIDKGGSDGLTNDLAVINGSGLVGKIVSVTPHTSTVKLLTNNIKLSVLVNQNIYGVLSYYNDKGRVFIIEGISNLDSIKVGDVVMTTGLSEIFTKGLMIGTVKKITYDSFGLSRILEVAPSVDYSNISFVSVLKRK